MSVNETRAAPTTPADKLGVVLGRLHPVTRLLLLAAALHLAGDLPAVLRFFVTLRSGGETAFAMLSQMVQAIGYSLTLVGGAASFEYIVLIWRELKLIRAAVDRSAPSAPAAE